MNEDEDYDYEDGEEITDCPNCNSTYDDADQDFLICSKCGWDAEENRFKPGNINDRKPKLNMTEEKFWLQVRVNCPYGKYYAAHITCKGIDYYAEARLQDGEMAAKENLFSKLKDLGHIV